MRVLIVAPYPPPLTGNSLPILRLDEHLQALGHEVHILNLNKSDHGAGLTSIRRIIYIIAISYELFKIHKRFDRIVITVAESVAGNFRDILFYLILRARIESVVIQMLGGASMDKILSLHHPILFHINRFLLKKIGRVIVEGEKQKNTFARILPASTIKVIPNFAEDFLFISQDDFNMKHTKYERINILFLSNMLYGKGHLELAKVVASLSHKLQHRIQVDFAGKLLYGDNEFYSLIQNLQFVKYHGSVNAAQKRHLYQNAHIFCLPTYYPYEGQPFSILEAYAGGAMVVTTDHSGIGDIFTNGINGLFVDKRSISSLQEVLEKIILQPIQIREFAKNNLLQARENHRSSVYLSNYTQVLTTLC